MKILFLVAVSPDIAGKLDARELLAFVAAQLGQLKGGGTATLAQGIVMVSE